MAAMRAAVLVSLLVGCHNRTELMIGVATDIRAPNLIDEVDLDVANTANGVSQTSEQWSLTGVADEPFNLPGSFGIFSADDSEPEVNITLTGLKNGSPILVRHAILNLVSDQTLFYRIGITAGCETVQDCSGSDMTCIEGRCVNAHLDAHRFPTFSDDLVTTLSCNSAIQYLDTGTGQPMPTSSDAASCPASQCAEGTCLAPCPSGQVSMNGTCVCTGGSLPVNGMCANSLADAGVIKGGDGGAGGPPDANLGCVTPMLYNIAWNCTGTVCPNSYPGTVGSVALDATGNGDYVKDPAFGIDGSCTSTLTGCQAMITCSITQGATGHAMGQIQFEGKTGTGMINYVETSGAGCNEACSVTLSPGGG